MTGTQHPVHRPTDHRRTHMGLLALAAVAAALAVTACPPESTTPITADERTLSFDVRNALFNAPDPESPATQGLGATTTLTLTVTTDPAPPGGAWTATLELADLDLTAGSNGYTRVPILVEGTLLSVAATVTSASGTFTHALTDYAGADIYQGWTGFGNVLKFRLAYVVGSPVSASAVYLSVAPKGGSLVTVRADSGVAGTDWNKGFTDLSATLASKQVAVQIGLAENPADVTYDLYTLVVDKDIAALYNPDVNFDGTYVSDPWSPAWSYADIVGGRSVGGTVYNLAKYREAPYEAEDPVDGKLSLLVDLTSSTDPDLLTKYVLVAVVIHAGGLSIPADVLCVNIE